MKSPLSTANFWRSAGIILILAVTLTVSKLTATRKSDQLAQPLDTIGRSIAGFIGMDDAALGQNILAALKCDSYLSRRYRKQGLEADLFIAYYAQQRSGESMHSPKHCLPGAGWEIWNYSGTDISVGGRSVNVNKYSVSRDNERMLVLYWYQSKPRIIASEYLGKVLLARDALLQNSTAGSLVRVIVPDTPAALGEAKVFASELIPQVQRCFGN